MSATPTSPRQTQFVLNRVVVVEDHTAIAQMLRHAIERSPGLSVAGCARDLGEARELCRRAGPAVVVLDIGLPSGSGMTLLREMPALCPKSRVVIFSAYLRPGIVRAAILAGARGLVDKAADLEELEEAVRAVSAGQAYLSRYASEAARIMIREKMAGTSVQLVRLTEREKTVLKLIADGHSGKEIALRLGVSRHTVVSCRARLGRKTGVSGAARLARYAVQMGLVPEAVEGAAEAV